MSERSIVDVVRLAGELDVSRKHELRELLVLHDSARAVLLDLSQVTYADSTALTELLRFGVAASKEKIPVAVLATSPQFHRIIGYAGLNEAFAVFADRGRALSFLEQSRA